MPTLQIPNLAEGETYAGSYGDISGNITHVVLLPGDAEQAAQVDQLAWAASIGGDLPNRIEQDLLWEHCRNQFQEAHYWGKEAHYLDAGRAWFQHFYYGDQHAAEVDAPLRARAIRRVVQQ